MLYNSELTGLQSSDIYFYMSKPINLIGQKFGKLTVIEEAYRKKNVYWKCLCDCGAETTVIGSNLRNGHTTSCGCGRVDGAIKTAKKMLSANPRITSANDVYINSYRDGDLTFEQFLDISQKACYYCGISAEKSNIANKYKKRSATVLIDVTLGEFRYNGLDRINSSKAHDFNNVVPCCKWCNTAKMNRSLEDFTAWIEQIYNYQKNKNGN